MGRGALGGFRVLPPQVTGSEGGLSVGVNLRRVKSTLAILDIQYTAILLNSRAGERGQVR